MIDVQLDTALHAWRADPRRMVRDLFHVQPDAWQAEVLAAFPHRQRLAMKACKGPGKTAVLSWLAWNFLLTRPRCKVAATSVTGDNLSDGLWTEMAKWRERAPLLKENFAFTRTRIYAREAPDTWWMSARRWSRSARPDQQADTLAGLHADHILFLLDEAGAIPDAVMAAAEAALASGEEARLVMAGNPTQVDGPLHRACTSEAHLWTVTEITGDPDAPNRSARVSAEWARQQIDKYGADNPWVLVNVFGRFPPASLNGLLGPDEVQDAMARVLDAGDYAHAAKVLGVDVARQGDDRTVIFPRQGLRAGEPVILRGADTQEVARRVALEADGFGAHAILVDETGGWGAGVVDALRALGRRPIGVQFAGRPTDPRFLNKRAEIWWAMAQWVKEGAALPREPDLKAELTAATYAFTGDRIQLEDKAHIKARLGRSPDLADALALTFAQPVQNPAVARRDWKRRARARRGNVWGA